MAGAQVDGRRAQVGDRLELVADHDHRSAVPGHLAHLAEALGLEVGVAHGQDLVHDQDLAVEMGGHGKGQADVHPGGVPLDLGVEEPFGPGEVDDGVEALVDLLAPHPEEGPVEIDVLPPGELGMESRPHLEQAAHPPPELDAARGRGGDPVDDLEQGALAGTVSADDAHHLAPAHVKGHAVQGFELLEVLLLPLEALQQGLGRVRLLVLLAEDPVGLGDIRNRNGRVGGLGGDPRRQLLEYQLILVRRQKSCP